VYQFIKNPQKFEQAAKKSASKDAAAPSDASSEPPSASRAAAGLVGALLSLFLLLLAAPFFGLTSVSGLISLFIIFIGLKQAWTLTGRSEVLVTGPYGTAPAQ